MPLSSFCLSPVEDRSLSAPPCAVDPPSSPRYLNALVRPLCYSEPFPLTNVAVRYKNQGGNTKEVLEFTHCVVKMLSKPLKAMPSHVDHNLKSVPLAADCMYPIKAFFPQATFLYLYQDMTMVSLSLCRLSFMAPNVR